MNLSLLTGNLWRGQKLQNSCLMDRGDIIFIVFFYGHRFALIDICSLWSEKGLETKWVTACFALLFFLFFLFLISNEHIQSADEKLCSLKAPEQPPDLEVRLFLRSRMNCEPEMYQSVITSIDSDLQTVNVHCHRPVDFSSLGCRESSHPGCLRPAVQPRPQSPQQRPPSGLLLLLFLLLHL